MRGYTLIRRYVPIATLLCLCALPGHAQEPQPTCAEASCEQITHDLDAILQTGDAVQIRAALIARDFEVPVLRLDSVEWLVRPTGYRPDPPLPAQFIPLDALAEHLMNGDIGNDPLFQTFYLYALDAWPLARITQWFETASDRFAPPAGSPAYHPLRDHQISIIYQHLWDQNLPEATRLRALWRDNMGTHDPLDRALQHAEIARIYPESERFGPEFYSDYVAEDALGGPCRYIRDYITETERYLLSSSHAYLARRRMPAVAQVVDDNWPAIIESCDMSPDAGEDGFNIALGVADLIGMDGNLRDMLVQTAAALDNRCAQFAARARIGTTALTHNNPAFARDMLQSLALGELHGEGESAFRAYECASVSTLNFGPYDIDAERDERLSLPVSIPELFMRCLGDAACNRDNVLVQIFGTNALEAGVVSINAFALLPDPAADPDHAKKIVTDLNALFAQTGFSAAGQRRRIWSWVLSWDDPATASATLDAVAPWFLDMPVPEISDGTMNQYLAYAAYLDRAPDASVFRDVLRSNLQRWQDTSAGPAVDFITAQVGDQLLRD